MEILHSLIWVIPSPTPHLHGKGLFLHVWWCRIVLSVRFFVEAFYSINMIKLAMTG
jgi:hypothetical protein